MQPRSLVLEAQTGCGPVTADFSLAGAVGQHRGEQRPRRTTEGGGGTVVLSSGSGRILRGGAS